MNTCIFLRVIGLCPVLALSKDTHVQIQHSGGEHLSIERKPKTETELSKQNIHPSLPR
jgi:hypothetical protein